MREYEPSELKFKKGQHFNKDTTDEIEARKLEEHERKDVKADL